MEKIYLSSLISSAMGTFRKANEPARNVNVLRGNCWIVFDYRETTSEKSDCRTGEFAGSRLANYGVIPPLTTRNPELPARSIVLAGTACYIPAVPPQLHHLEWSKIEPESSVATSIRCMVARVRVPNLKASEASHHEKQAYIHNSVACDSRHNPG